MPIVPFCFELAFLRNQADFQGVAGEPGTLKPYAQISTPPRPELQTPTGRSRSRFLDEVSDFG